MIAFVEFLDGPGGQKKVLLEAAERFVDLGPLGPGEGGDISLVATMEGVGPSGMVNYTAVIRLGADGRLEGQMNLPGNSGGSASRFDITRDGHVYELRSDDTGFQLLSHGPVDDVR
jgi:hypothetical protein